MADVCKFKAGNLVFELDATDEKVLFAKIAHLQEIFEQKCAKCDGTDLRMVMRNVEKDKKEYVYYEYHCNNQNCRAKLSLGVKQQSGELFPKRKDESGEYVGTYGWKKWDKELGKEV